MKTKILLFFCVTLLITGGIYVYYKALPPKGKATGIVEKPEIIEKKMDNIFRLADINNDKLAEIILLKKPKNNMYVFDIKGNLFNGWPKDSSYPAIGDINNDGYKEIVNIMDNKIYVYDQFGAQINGFPVTLDKQPVTAPVLADLDNNSALEIICGSNMPLPIINVVTGNGYFLSGWQEKIVVPSAKTGYPFALAAGDMNNDNEVEVVILAQDRLFVFNNQGEVISRSLVLGLEDKGVSPLLILADFNLDNVLEIVLVYGNELCVRNVDNELFKIKMENNILSTILGDLNGDNKPEIILTMPLQKIYAYDSAGKLITGWPKEKIIGNAIIGDINSDGINEIIAVTKPFDVYEIDAYDINGKSINGWPISLNYTVNSTLALSDIDDDRLIEIVFADTEGNIRIIKTCGMVSTGAWPELSSDIYNDGVWGNWYVLIDRERGIKNKEEVLAEATNIAPLYIKPEFKILVQGKDLTIQEKEPDAGIMPILFNLALDAHITSSSEYSDRYKAQNITDGLLGQWDEGEWASKNEQTPWIKLSWDNAQTINTIILYDRPNRFDEILNARIDFSDGSSLVAGMLPNSGSPKKIIFNDKNVNWIKIQILESAGSMNAGLAEVCVFYCKPVDAELNFARKAQITASSEYSDKYKAQNIIDGLLGQWDSGEWASKSEQTPWIKLNWDSMQTINTIVLYDRPNRFDEVLNARVDFSDGSSIITGMLPNSGSPKEIVFNDKNVNWIKLQIQESAGSLNSGFAEVEIYYTKAYENKNNLARNAKVTASSYYSPEYTPYKVIDGLLGQWDEGEWASKNEQTPWIKLIWDTPQTADTILLYDRPNRFDEIINARLDFSDGSSIVTGLLENSGAPKQVVFKPKTFAWVKLQILEGQGSMNAGLAEFSVFNSKETAPVIIKEPQTPPKTIIEEPPAPKIILTEEEKKAIIEKEVGKLKNMDPALIYTILDPQFENGKLIAYTCQVTNSLGTINRTVYIEIFYNQAGNEIGWGEYGKIEDGRIQYREAITNPDGGRQIWFAQAMNLEGTLEETVAKLKDKAKNMAVDRELIILKNLNPSLIYEITNPQYKNGRLIGYTCRERSPSGHYDRTWVVEILYDDLGNEAGCGKAWLSKQEGMVYYNEMVTDTYGKRVTWFYNSIAQQGTLENTIILVKKMAKASRGELDELKKEDPNRKYEITEPKIDDEGILVGCSYRRLAPNGENYFMSRGIFHNQDGKRIGFSESGRDREDISIWYRAGETSLDGGIKITFEEITYRYGVSVEEIISILKEKAGLDLEKRALLEKELLKLKNENKDLIYFARNFKFINGRFVGYECIEKNPASLYERIYDVEIFYNEAGSETGYGKAWLSKQEGRVFYSEMVTDTLGKRNMWFYNNMPQKGTLDETIALLKKMAKGSFAEYNELKKEDPNRVFQMTGSKFNDKDILTGYSYWRRAQNGTNYNMTREIIYDQNGKRTGFSEYGLAQDEISIQYREGGIDQDGNWQVWFDKIAVKGNSSVSEVVARLKEEAGRRIIYSDSEVFYDDAGKEIGYAEYKKLANGNVSYEEYVTDTQGKREMWFQYFMYQKGTLDETISILRNTAKILLPEFKCLKKENPNLRYEIIEYNFDDKGKLLSYAYRKRGGNTDFQYVKREFVFNKANVRIGFSEYGIFRGEDFVQYRTAAVSQNGDVYILFDETISRTGMTIEGAVAVLKEKSKSILVERELAKLKQIDPALIYTITNPEFFNGRLISYTLRETNSIGTIDRTSYRELFYDQTGKEIGFGGYIKVEGGRISYWEGITSTDGYRRIQFSHTINQQGTVEETVVLLKKMAKAWQAEMEKLKLENINIMDATVKVFNNEGVLLSYKYIRRDSTTPMELEVSREIFYNEEGKEVGFGEYCDNRDGKVRYREAVTDSNSLRNVWFDHAIWKQGTVSDTVALLKKLAKDSWEYAQSLNPAGGQDATLAALKKMAADTKLEVENLKKENPNYEYLITKPKFNDKGVLISYGYNRCSRASFEDMNREKFFDQAGKETGFGEYTKTKDNKIAYIETSIDASGNRRIQFSHTINQQGTVEETVALLKKMAKAWRVEMEKLKIENINIMDATVKVFNNEGVLLSYKYIRRDTTSPMELEVSREIFYNEEGKEVGFGEYCDNRDGKVRYREAVTDTNGIRKVFFDKSIPKQGTVEQTVAILKEMAKTLPEEEKLKKIDPVLIYTITSPEFFNGRLISYTCQVTNSIGTINRTVQCEVFYDVTGNETGWGEVWVAGDGNIQYREAVTNPDGGRWIWFAKGIRQQGTVEDTVAILKKMAAEAKPKS